MERRVRAIIFEKDKKLGLLSRSLSKEERTCMIRLKVRVREKKKTSQFVNKAG